MANRREALIQSGYTLYQAEEIEEGVAAKLNVPLYADKKFFAIQMRQIRLGLMENLPVEIYARPEFDWFQMEEIRLGLGAGLDVGVYAKPEVSYEVMRQLRLGMLDGLDLSGHMDLDAGVLRELRLAMRGRVDILEYIGQGYDDVQLAQIRLGLENGVDLSPYLDKKYRGVAIQEMRLGLEKGLDISCYADVELNWRQMREIRLGLERRVDVGKYRSALYTWRQMREIRLGLEGGVDVDAYRGYAHTAAEMTAMREKLLQDAAAAGPGPGAQEQLAEKVFDNFLLTVSEDEMEADVFVCGEGIRKEDLVYVMRQKGVRKGMLPDAIEGIVRGDYHDESVVVARGKESEAGEDGWYEFFFRTNVERTPKLLPDGSVDYQNIEWFELVEEGQKVAYYHEAQEGARGWTVTGRKLRAKKGREKAALSGKGFALQPDLKTYLAVIGGRIELLGEERLEITRALVMDEVSLATGNVNFDGSVYIKGNVGSGAVVRATEDVVVDGYVEAAVFEVGRNIILRQGANGGGGGHIRAGGSVEGKFFESAKVTAAGDIDMNYCLNCELSAQGQIHVYGQSGMIAGGTAYAAGGVEACNVGNQAGLKTFIRAGREEDIAARIHDLDDEIREVSKELKILQGGCEDFRKKFPPEVRNTMKVYLKLENAVFTKEKQLKELHAGKQRAEEELKEGENVCICVWGMVYEGAVVEINGVRWEAKKVEDVRLKRVRGRIAIYRN